MAKKKAKLYQPGKSAEPEETQTAPPGGAVCGPAESRTPVRTRKPYAFYMLIPAFIFVMQQDLNHQLHPYPLNLTRPLRPDQAIPDFPAPLVPQIRNNILGATSRFLTL